MKPINEKPTNEAILVSDSSNIINVLRNCKTYLTIDKIAALINYDEDDDPDLHFLNEKIEDIMFDFGMIEWKQGKGYKFNPEIKPVERKWSPRPDLSLPEVSYK